MLSVEITFWSHELIFISFKDLFFEFVSDFRDDAWIFAESADHCLSHTLSGHHGCEKEIKKLINNEVSSKDFRIVKEQGEQIVVISNLAFVFAANAIINILKEFLSQSQTVVSADTFFAG